MRGTVVGWWSGDAFFLVGRWPRSERWLLQNRTATGIFLSEMHGIPLRPIHRQSQSGAFCVQPDANTLFASSGLRPGGQRSSSTTVRCSIERITNGDQPERPFCDGVGLIPARLRTFRIRGALCDNPGVNPGVSPGVSPGPRTLYAAGPTLYLSLHGRRSG